MLGSMCHVITSASHLKDSLSFVDSPEYLASSTMLVEIQSTISISCRSLFTPAFTGLIDCGCQPCCSKNVSLARYSQIYFVYIYSICRCRWQTAAGSFVT